MATKSLQSQLERIHELHVAGYTGPQIAQFTGLKHGTIRTYLWRRRREEGNGQFDKCVKSKSCPECGGELFTAPDDSGEIVCKSCGMVVDKNTTLEVGDQKFGRAPTNRLLWNKNLGSDERQLLYQLRLKMKLKISTTSLRVDDSHICRGCELMTKKLMTHGLGYGETDEIAKQLRRELKKLTKKELVEEAVEKVYTKFFPGG